MTHPGPPRLGVDSTELTDLRYGNRMANYMISQDFMTPDEGCSFLEIRRHLEEYPLPTEPGQPHWDRDYGDHFTSYGWRRALTGVNEPGPYMDSAAHRKSSS